MSAGRPTKLDEDLIAAAAEYASGGYMEHNEVIPSVEGLASCLRVSRASIYNWKEQSPEFMDILEDILAKQAKTLMNSGLMGDFNSTITKLMLTKHGYSDKIEQDVTSSDQSLRPTHIILEGVSPKATDTD
jgi:hypothetical protein